MAYLCCGGLVVAALLAARAEIPGKCGIVAEADVDVELGREIGSTDGGGRT